MRIKNVIIQYKLLLYYTAPADVEELENHGLGYQETQEDDCDDMPTDNSEDDPGYDNSGSAGSSSSTTTDNNGNQNNERPTIKWPALLRTLCLT